MPIEIRCRSCGFLLGYAENSPVSIYDVLRKWGFRCPCCLSNLEPLAQMLHRLFYGFYLDEHDKEQLESIQWHLETLKKLIDDETM